MGDQMKRRDFLARSAAAAGGMVLWSSAALAAPAAGKLQGYAEVDQELFKGINRVQNPAEKTGLEKKHAPVIEVPAQIKAGEPFAVTVSIGEVAHPMVAVHYIQYVELLAGNEPAGRVEFRPGLNAAKASFFLTLDKPVTLVAREYCNLHGLWESRQDVAPA